MDRGGVVRGLTFAQSACAALLGMLLALFALVRELLLSAPARGRATAQTRRRERLGHRRRAVRIRDGRTSTETLRERGGEGEEFTVLDRAGRLRLSRDHVERYGLRGRVRLTGGAGHVGVWPDRDDRSDG
ncbi:hypothetical protein DXZ75_32810 [Streptomyces sp. AcE210]|nr:hypothetical protein DXZ75_32810 [Streptomyces sp. AcE210]